MLGFGQREEMLHHRHHLIGRRSGGVRGHYLAGVLFAADALRLP